MNNRLYVFPLACLLLLYNALPVMAAVHLSTPAAAPALFADGAMTAFLVIYFLIVVVSIASMWVIYTKAGQPGWAAIVPFYNLVVMCWIIGRPGWWWLLMMIPIAGIVFAIMMVVELAGKFGKGGGFAVGMIFLPFIFYPLLAFGDAEYEDRSRRKKARRRYEDEEEEEEERPRRRVRRDDD
jgi:hypothetical protein